MRPWNRLLLPMNSATNLVLRILVHLARGADLLDDGVAHDDDFVGERHRFLLRMRDHDEGDVQITLHFLQFDHHRLAQIEIERTQRLVEQEHCGPADQAPAPAQRAAAGRLKGRAGRRSAKLVSPTISSISHTRLSRAVFSMPFIFRLNSTFWNTVRCGNSAKLWNIIEVSRRAGGQIGDVFAGDDDRTFGHFLQAADHPQRCRLAATGRPEHRDEFAVLDFGVEVDDRPGTARIGLGDVFENDVGLISSLPHQPADLATALIMFHTDSNGTLSSAPSRLNSPSTLTAWRMSSFSPA